MSVISSRKIFKNLIVLAVFALLAVFLFYRLGGGFGLSTPDSPIPPVTDENTVHFSEAPDRVGNELWVRGKIDHVYVSDNGNHFLNFCSDFRECPFSVVIFSDHAEGLDTSLWSGREIYIYGLVGTYEGRPQIVVEDIRQVLFEGEGDLSDLNIDESGSLCSGRLVRVVNVIDGDTIWVEIEGVTESVRLIGVDAPEVEGPYSEEECYGSEAAEYVSELLEGESVVIKDDPSVSDRDAYDRLLRYVYLPDGELLNLLLVREGYALVYGDAFERAEVFLEAEEEAREVGRGLWGEGCDY